MAKRRTLADQQRIQREVEAAMAKPRGEPVFGPSGIGFAASPKSNCCGASVHVSGNQDGTQCHVCDVCGRPCDARL